MQGMCNSGTYILLTRTQGLTFLAAFGGYRQLQGHVGIICPMVDESVIEYFPNVNDCSDLNWSLAMFNHMNVLCCVLQAVRALCMMAVLYVLMWYLNLLPTQSEDFLAGRSAAAGGGGGLGSPAGAEAE
jgi:hypothetical protein